jgi:ceramide glucosyltransferase
VLSNHIINNVNEYWGIGKFMNRHTRWGKLRWKIGGVTYLSELLANAVFMSVIPLIFLPLTKLPLLLAGGTSAIKMARDFYLGKRVGAGMHPLLYLIAPFKDLIIGLLWFVPVLSNTVAWRGNRYCIGKDSLLSPYPETGRRPWRPGIVTLIKTRLAPSKS